MNHDGSNVPEFIGLCGYFRNRASCTNDKIKPRALGNLAKKDIFQSCYLLNLIENHYGNNSPVPLYP